jgi:hypothetical protein
VDQGNVVAFDKLKEEIASGRFARFTVAENKGDFGVYMALLYVILDDRE